MSYLFTLTGNTSELSSNFFPPITLENEFSYTLGLTGFETFNSCPNIDERNNKFYYDDKELRIPCGAYEIENISSFLRENLGDDAIKLTANEATLKCEITSKYKIDFSQEGTIGPILGFSPKILEPNKKHVSDSPVQIVNISSVLVECNLINNSYINHQLSHVLFAFSISEPPGFKIVEIPSSVIYLPVKTKQIDNITLRIVDQDENLVNFRNEKIVVRLHLRREL